MQLLRHDLHHPERRAEVIARGRTEAGLEGADDEVAEIIRSYVAPDSKGRFAGQFLSGIFCDVEGTLLRDDDTVNQAVLANLERLEGEGREITLWTGGDLKKVRPRLHDVGIFYTLVSKHDFRGAEVEVAIDDLSQADFEQEYGITAKQYLQM